MGLRYTRNRTRTWLPCRGVRFSFFLFLVPLFYRRPDLGNSFTLCGHQVVNSAVCLCSPKLGRTTTIERYGYLVGGATLVRVKVGNRMTGWGSENIHMALLLFQRKNYFTRKPACDPPASPCLQDHDDRDSRERLMSLSDV